MRAYVLRRLALVVPMLLGITVITFLFINLAPGDAVTAMISPVDQLRAEDLDRLRESLGLNKPVPVQYGLWLKEVVQGNFGYSTYNGRPVAETVRRRLWPTLELTGAALLIATVVGTLFGVIAALKQYSFYDYFLSVVSLFGLSIPAFFFALVALFVFAAAFPIFPAFGISSGTGGFSLPDHLRHLVLPASTLSIELVGATTRYARTAMLEVMRSDYVTTARAKGLSEVVVIGRHAFRNALLPLITVTTLRLPLLLGGAVVIETMFSWPGLGQLSVDAIRARDFPTLMSLTLFVSAIVLFANLLADILYAYADPRIRVS